MTGDASKLMSIHWRHGEFVTYGDHNRGRILGSGDIGKKGSLIIKDVFLVEGLNHNLLSINQLFDKGLQVTFEPILCLIVDSTSRKIVLVSKRMNNVYMLNISCITLVEKTLFITR